MAGLLAAMMAVGVVPAGATTLTVTTTDDELNADGDCSLREAIRAANTDTAVDACPAGDGADEITVPAGTYTLTIEGRAEDAAATGDLDITSDVTIHGAGAGATTIQACAPIPPDTTCMGLDRVLHVDPAGAHITASISGVTVQNGQTELIAFVDSAGGGILLGIANTAGGTSPSGTLTITDSTVRNNSVPRNGGGIANKGGTLTLANSTVSGNSAGTGGGIFSDGKLAVEASTVTSNSAGEGGGVACAFQEATVTRSTVSDNQSNGFGAGISSYRATLRLTNSTISGNRTPASGGGIFNNQGQVTLNNSTVTNNDAGTPQAGGEGGGISNGGTVSLSNTILAGNRVAGGPADCGGTLTSDGYNLIQSASCPIAGDLTGNIIGEEARLGPLTDNGGPTATHALLAGSPALDAGNPAAPGSGDTACQTTDQRGVQRPQRRSCDIGAFEFVGSFNCPGDCDDNGVVTIDELIKGVNIALGSLLITDCPAFDLDGNEQVTIDELVKAVNAALTAACERN